MGDQAKFGIGSTEVEMPVLKGTLGPDVVDIRKLYAATDVFTYDPGFTSTASCESKITFIDGDKGVLLHRGYPIDELAEQSSFLEVCHVLLHGELPTADEFTKFDHNITYHTMLHEQFDRFFQGFRRDAHPMAIMVGTVGALSLRFITTAPTSTIPKQRIIASAPSDRQNADDRSARVQVLPCRPTVRAARGMTSRLRVELPAHVLLRCQRKIT